MRIFQHGYSDGFDGPGNRLIFYLKGCDFRCDWCASPESISFEPQILCAPERHPEKARYVCPKGAVQSDGTLDRALCDRCETHDCVTVWRHQAFTFAGSRISTEEIVDMAEAARNWISGVTFGGGEPTLQIDALVEAAEALRRNGFHLAIESNASTATYRRAIPHFDFVFSDLKTLDPAIAAKRIGADISQVADNLRFAVDTAGEFCLRIPVVTGVNDFPAARQEIKAFLVELTERRKRPGFSVQLLRQHHLGEPKYRALGIPYGLAGTDVPGKELLADFTAELVEAKVNATYFG